ncbi:Transcriptional regulatory protein ZraR [Gimesia alba]|uniref:Transcriptional regulatory protein ZraR n=1 Tax=Gimesia alba TaxID=2527973 RepID=A0A517RCV0_9PLAN|nr:sigma-54 dependent transcriptional regulator [Gimesia alba]QDT41711.1 Transcriptional regulatory protein ZraR [Gimesia alba]
MQSDGFGILIIDDEPNIRSGLAKGLAREADVVETANDGEEGLARFQEGFFQLVIADVRLPGEMDGLELIQQMLRSRPQTTAIIITAHGTVETAVKAMRLGAFDFITKPLDLNLIRHQVRKAREHHRLQIENRELRNRLVNAGEVSNIIGNCAAMHDVFQQIRQVAATDATVLIQGESGTGKELIARALHDLSNRSSGPFVAVNLGAMPETLLESELFGHEKGSFSGATRQKPGCFEQAQGGSLFLDEVTEMPAKSQVDLLRVLETQQFMRVGGEEVMKSDARIISATNKSVEPLIEEGTFREDLFYRLNVIPIHVPALRERRDDIPLLVEHFLTHFCQRHNRPHKKISPEAMQKLVSARWPGNVRQLRNVIERLVVTLPGDVIHATDLPDDLNPAISSSSEPLKTLAEVTEDAEKAAISAALAVCDYHREKTAKMLGVSVRTLHYKMSRYGLH